MNTLGPGMPFGEMALLKAGPAIRGAYVKTKVDCSLAILELKDFLFIME